jgi:hypothetical protein
MFLKMSAAVFLFGALSYASAGTRAIGTASADGDMRVDGYQVKGDATLFDGTVVETGQASAVLRMQQGTEVKLATGSKAIVHPDCIILQQGTTEWSGSNSFLLEARGLHVSPSAPDSRGLVSVSGAGAVEVEALGGTFRVTDYVGLFVANVQGGNAMSFATPEYGAPGAKATTLIGDLSKVEGCYLLKMPSPNASSLFEVRGKNLDRLIGKRVSLTGSFDLNLKPMGGASHVFLVSSAKKAAAGMTTAEKTVLGTAIAGGAAGAAIAVASGKKTPASP